MIISPIYVINNPNNIKLFYQSCISPISVIYHSYISHITVLYHCSILLYPVIWVLRQVRAIYRRLMGSPPSTR